MCAVPMVAQADESGVTFAAPAQGSVVHVKISFQNVQQYRYLYDAARIETPYVAMDGTIEVEVRMTVDRVLEYEAPPQVSRRMKRCAPIRAAFMTASGPGSNPERWFTVPHITTLP